MSDIVIQAENLGKQSTIGHQALVPNEKLLHLILRGRWDAEALEKARALAARDGVMWDDFLQAARAEGVSPLVYEAVRGQSLLPAAVEDSLRLDYYGAAVVERPGEHSGMGTTAVLRIGEPVPIGGVYAGSVSCPQPPAAAVVLYLPLAARTTTRRVIRNSTSVNGVQQSATPTAAARSASSRRTGTL